ncbi:LysM peptidoglycan-binding domain-containing protein [Peribacillus cavernae]|uniref:LysM peptidoglycan-binding domain-containing protein n=1 Tax=Peribacillus cavernae TaxID=1674310 RepID=A0A433HIS8_9BACI|nr:cell wall hydrolase [Peribacillus cavernae]MDQ0217834.1 N-acetylmuramoyl-L-alanine amidase [Peribacillus cavernae]RUQ28278.1 LysM peptidoglycan-binding domain-containing protein [Peribacillus cavernae]
MDFKVIFSFILALCIITLGLIYYNDHEVKASASGNKHVVKQGESIWYIAKLYGVPIQELKKANHNDNNVVEPGDKLVIPKAMSDSDKELLARLVHAEAKGEPYRGKVAVAAVVLNRIQSEEFPDTVSKVIYQENQFSPVADGSIKKPAGEDAIRAVNEAIAIEGYTYKELYFYNPSISKSKWMRQLKINRVIGKHHFALE